MKPFVTANERPADYEHDLSRGTVTFDPGVRNYALHKVSIPDGTTLRECNFSQCVPNTDAIRGRNLTFIDCNLVNVKIDASWRLQRSNTTQAWRVDAGGGRERMQYICKHPNDLRGDEQEPANVVKSRAY